MTKPSIKALDASAGEASCEALRRAERKLRLEIADANFHPLETFAYFRRWPRSLLRNLIYTLIFNAMFAAAFTFITVLATLTSGRTVSPAGLIQIIANNLLISNVIGFAYWGVLELIEPVMRWINLRGFFLIVMFYAVLGTLVVTGSFFLVSFIPGFQNIGKWLFTPSQLAASFLISLVISTVIAVIWQRRTKELGAQLALAEERERAGAAERAAVQANLRALQAQIEPHFLFNTLANVTSLIHSKPDDAKRMLEEFIAYLRATLVTTRAEEATLAQEFALMKSFLSVLQIRMGNRLRVSVSLPTELAGMHIAPMLIQPLVENAIKHGLEPKIEGGEILLSATRHGQNVEIVVADTGLGFQGSTSSGIGLKNVRARLDMIYNGQATLNITDNQPTGTKLTISIPAP